MLGVEIADEPSLAGPISRELVRSERYKVEQFWVQIRRPYFPKFVLLNELMRDIEDIYEFVIVTDDDITLPPHFLDRYLGIVEQRGFALAQPARTHNSAIHHRIVEQVDGLESRETRFVEIGPLFSMRRDALPLLTPFDARTPMGWGLEFVWPVALKAHGLKQGIVDATPVEHMFRPPLSLYSSDEGARMEAFLTKTPHLPRDMCYTELARFTA